MQRAIRIQPCGPDVELVEGSFSRMSAHGCLKDGRYPLSLFLVVVFLFPSYVFTRKLLHISSACMRTFFVARLRFPGIAIETVIELSRDQAHGIFYYETRIKQGQPPKQDA